MNKIVIGTRSLMYKKFLKFPLIRDQEHSTGSIMNYMLVDIENLGRLYSLLPTIIQFPIMLFGGIFLIYNAVGIAFVGGIFSVLLISSFVSKISKILFT